MEIVQSDRLWSKFLKTNGYQLVSCIGQGSFGDVYSVTCLDTDKAWAVKRLVARRDIQEDSYAMAEIEALATIQHPTVVGLKEILVCPRLACIVMELAPAGNLEMLVLHGHAGDGFSLGEMVLADVTLRKLNSYCFDYDVQHMVKSNNGGQRQSELENDIYMKFGIDITHEEFGTNQGGKEGTGYRIEDDADGAEALPPCYSTPPASSTSSTPVLDPTFLSIAFTQITSALAFCHDLDLAHRDVNPSNILVFRPDLVKLADFGLCFRCRDDDEENGNACSAILCSDFLGRERYSAPEVRRQEPFQAKPADVWSLACVLFFMLRAHHPPLNNGNLFDGVTNEVSKLVPAVYDVTLASKCVETLVRAGQILIKERPTMRHILKLWDT